MPDFDLEHATLQKLVQGGMEVNEDLSIEPLFAPNLDYRSKGNYYIVGIDEAGCGPWAGPVSAGAVIFLDHDSVPKDLLALLDDSKKLTEKRREKAYKLLFSYEGTHCHIGYGQTSEGEIDRINIRQAALLAMKRAVESLPVNPHFALVDGIALPNLDCPAGTFKKGDGRSFSIAAASIIAKVTRDRLMKKLAQEYPQYTWERNAGYGTKAHKEALEKYGVTPYHRKSFAPIARLLSDHQKAA